MKFQHLILSLALGLALAAPAVSADNKPKDGRKERQKHLVGEAKEQRGSTSINFDEADISGKRRNPLGTQIGKDSPDHDFDLVKLRLRWHPEMIQSTSGLDTGKGR